MILTIAEEWTDTVSLDGELTSIPDSGMYLNSGVHPSITVGNLLSLLPDVDFTFVAFNVGTTYGKYTDTRKVTDIVIDVGIIYQSKTAGNTGNTPATSPNEWLPTDIDSLRIKTFALSSQDNAIKKINLTRRLVDSQYLYNVVEVNEQPVSQLLPNDFAAWVFEPKGSDYVTFKINQVAFQATTAIPQNLYVINQGVLITTLTLNPNAQGRLVFEDVPFTFTFKGRTIFAVDSQNVLTDGAVIDPLKYDGFVAYMASGIGVPVQDSVFSFGTSNNGLNFNISTYLDANVYMDNNLVNFANYLQASWELDVLNMFLVNANNRSNDITRKQINRELLIAETKELKAESVLTRFKKEKKEAIKQLEKTFDREINDNDIEIEITSV